MRDVKVLLRDVMGQVVYNALLIDNREIQQQLGVVAGLLKQGGKNFVQGVALLDEQQPEQLIQLVLRF